MRYSIRVAKGVRLRPSSRGLGVSLGRGRTWIYLGPRGAGASTSVGPVRFYNWYGGSGSRRTTPAQQQRRAAQAEHIAELQALADRVQHIVSIHKADFLPAQPPVAPPVEPVDVSQLETKHRKEALRGVPFWRRKERRAAKDRAQEVARTEAEGEMSRREAERLAVQQELNEHWRLLQANDPEIVLETLEAAFSDNESPAVAVDCEEGRATVVLLVGGEDVVPERVPAVTPTGRPSARKLSQTDHNKLYMAWLFSNVLVTLKEAFAVCPGLAAVTMVVMRREPTTPFGDQRVSAIYCGTFTRERFNLLDFSSENVVDAPLYADDVLLKTKGRTLAVQLLDLNEHPQLAEVVQQVHHGLSAAR